MPYSGIAKRASTFGSPTYNALWEALCDITPLKGEWIFPRHQLAAIAELRPYAPKTRHDAVGAFRTEIIRPREEGDWCRPVPHTWLLEWVFDR